MSEIAKNFIAVIDARIIKKKNIQKLKSLSKLKKTLVKEENILFEQTE